MTVLVSKNPDHVVNKKCLELYKKGESDQYIASVLNLNPNTVWKWRKRNGLIKPTLRGRNPDLSLNKLCMSLYEDGLNDDEIARRIQLSPISIMKWRKEHNLPLLCNKVKKIVGEVHGKCLRLYNNKMSDASIANIVGVNENTIRHWRNENNLKPNQKKVKIEHFCSYKKALPPEKHEHMRKFLSIIETMKSRRYTEIDLKKIREVYQEIVR